MKNRWIILAAGVLIQTVFGGIYAWSSFTSHLINNYGLSKGQCGFIFGLTIAVFTLAMTFSGRLMTKIGPRLTTAIGAVLFMCGYLFASFSGGSYIILLLSIGCISGVGIGLGYVCPLSVGMKWFPTKKGLVTGVAVGGFGGGAILISAIAGHFPKEIDVLLFFRWLSITAGVLLLLASFMLIEPSQEEKVKTETVNLKATISPQFLLLVLCIFAGTFSGLLVIGNLIQIVKTVGLTANQAVSTISIFSIGNVIGRISWGHLFDRFHYKTIPSSLALFALFFPLLLVNLPSYIIMVVVGLMGFGFGANFVVYAGAISKYFGTDGFTKLYPICFLGYGFAGLVGPSTGGFLADMSGSYNTALYLSTAIVSAAAILSFVGLGLYASRATEAVDLNFKEA